MELLKRINHLKSTLANLQDNIGEISDQLTDVNRQARGLQMDIELLANTIPQPQIQSYKRKER